MTKTMGSGDSCAAGRQVETYEPVLSGGFGPAKIEFSGGGGAKGSEADKTKETDFMRWFAVWVGGKG
jgi:hypothetical protein